MTQRVSELGAYPQKPSLFWWTRKRTYFLFVMRELSSLFVGWFVFYLLLFLAAVGKGEQAYLNFLDDASHPLLVTVNVVALAFLALHTITWFALTPQAMVLRVGGRRVPGAAIVAAQYAGLVVVSGLVYWLVTR